MALVVVGMTILIGDANQSAIGSVQMQVDHGSISGTVTALATGEPLEGICVSAESFSLGSGSLAFTDELGMYEITGLAEGAYDVAFFGCFSSPSNIYFIVYYDSQPDPDSADLVTVTAGVKTSGVDAQMVAGGVISGALTNVTAAPLEGTCVIFANLSFHFMGFALTNELGEYSMRLRSGDYKVRFACGEEGPYLLEWYDNRGDFDSADVISVSEGSLVSGIDARLAAALLGDVDCNGTVNAIDAALLLQFDARLLFDPSLGRIMLCLALGDVNGDRVRDAIDASLILQFDAGLLDSLRSS